MARIGEANRQRLRKSHEILKKYVRALRSVFFAECCESGACRSESKGRETTNAALGVWLADARDLLRAYKTVYLLGLAVVKAMDEADRGCC